MKQLVQSWFKSGETHRAFQVGRVVLVIGFALSIVATVHPGLRSTLRNALMKENRTVVSTASGDLLGTGSTVVVAKVKTNDSLLLEVYESNPDGRQRLVERIQIPHKKDGYFNFNGVAINLAIDDIDGDGKLEILAPSFDQNLVGHLNVYRYDSIAGVFQRSIR